MRRGAAEAACGWADTPRAETWRCMPRRTHRSPVQARLEAVYNNDGPGFCAGALDETGYAAVRERIRTFVPQTSIVGMLLDHEERYTVVRSRQVGLLQHDPFSWQVEGPDFVRLETVTSSSRFLSLTLKNWVASMDRERREAFVDALFDILAPPERIPRRNCPRDG